MNRSVLNFNVLLVTEVFLVPEDVRPPVCELEDTLLQPLEEDAQPDILSSGDGKQAGRHKVPQPVRLDRSNIYKLKKQDEGSVSDPRSISSKTDKTDKNEVTDRLLYKKSFCTVHAYFCQGTMCFEFVPCIPYRKANM
jgi:hypothetical protein